MSPRHLTRPRPHPRPSLAASVREDLSGNSALWYSKKGSASRGSSVKYGPVQTPQVDYKVGLIEGMLRKQEAKEVQEHREQHDRLEALAIIAAEKEAAEALKEENTNGQAVAAGQTPTGGKGSSKGSKGGKGGRDSSLAPAEPSLVDLSLAPVFSLELTPSGPLKRINPGMAATQAQLKQLQRAVSSQQGGPEAMPGRSW